MRARRWQVLALLVALLVASRASASVVFISQEDNGREFALDRGDALEISLPATSGTGYTWQAEPIAGGFAKQIGEPAYTLDNAMPGASGHQIFHFGIEASGSGTLEIRYLRPWEKGSKPAKVFKIMLIVR
ncbi:protease inhibitor I42 family protein [Candidatus Binatus sp.]|uniref:protease inhibitor I42 family protein n=1 Tax=Candidatus Binatus sp. TaxID=2811406 RepID=UPI003CC59B81